MDRCAVFVDAGYLYGAATSLLAGSSARRTLRTDQEAMIASIRELAEAETGMPLLRIYWYDAARNKVPQPEQRTLALLSDVKLRLGNLRRRDDGRYMQKGVDADLHADMTQLARNGGASDFVLVSGDEDLLRAVDEAQGYGVRLHLWGVDAGFEGFNQSLELSAAADRRHHLDESFLRKFFEVVPDPEELAAGIEHVAAATVGDGTAEPERPEAVEAVEVVDAAAPDDAVAPTAEPAPERPQAPSSVDGSLPPLADVDGTTTPDAGPPSEPSGARPAPPEADQAAANGSAADGSAAPAVEAPTEPAPSAEREAGPQDEPVDTAKAPSPAELARAVPRGSARPTEPGGVASAATREYLKLSELSTREERFRDAEEDAGRAGDTPYDVGRTYGARWRLRATQFAVSSVRNLPSVPRSIDGDLLRYAERRGVDTWRDDAKAAVRKGFLEALRD